MSSTEADNVLSALGLPANVRTGPGSPQEIRVRFINYSFCEVDLLWINPSGQPVRFARLKRRQYLDIKTFENHPWVFRESSTGVALQALVTVPAPAQKVEVFWPATSANNRVIHRVAVPILSPVYTLREHCVRAICLRVRIDAASINSLPLPLHLLNDIRVFLLRLVRYQQFVSPNQLIANQLLPPVNNS